MPANPTDADKLAEAVTPSTSTHYFHMHCEVGCEKAVGERYNGKLVCVRCGAMFVECSPEVCP